MDDEVGAFLDREVRAAQRGDRRVSARRGALPQLVRLHRFAAGELLVLYALSKETALRPPPYLAPERVDDDEVVCLSVGEVELHVLRAAVRDVECEMHVALRDGHVELRRDFRGGPGGGAAAGDFFCRWSAGVYRDCASERFRRLRMRARTTGERERACDQ